VNPDLVLSYFEDNGIVALRAETPRGHIEEFELDGVWTKVVAFIAGTGSFEVAALPGDLSEYEKQEIAASLEVSGLFTSGDQ
jgi:hypothetical protein